LCDVTRDQKVFRVGQALEGVFVSLLEASRFEVCNQKEKLHWK
jgi:hypothetical protein